MKKFPSIIALICIIVYVGAVVFSAYGIYRGVEQQKALARQELDGLAAMISQNSFIEEQSRRMIQERAETNRALEGIIITGSSGLPFVYEKEQGKTVDREGDNPRFVKRFGLVDLPAQPVDVAGLRNVTVHAVYNPLQYENFMELLKRSLTAILGALVLAFFTLILQAIFGGRKARVKTAPERKVKKSRTEEKPPEPSDDAEFSDFIAEGAESGGSEEAAFGLEDDFSLPAEEPPAENAGDPFDFEGFDDFAGISSTADTDFGENGPAENTPDENFGLPGEEAPAESEESFDLPVEEAPAESDENFELPAEENLELPPEEPLDESFDLPVEEAPDESPGETAPAGEDFSLPADEDFDLPMEEPPGENLELSEEESASDEAVAADKAAAADETAAVDETVPAEEAVQADLPIDKTAPGDFSPESGLNRESGVLEKLEAELQSPEEGDVTALLLECGETVECDGERYKKLAGEALDFFGLEGLTFERGDRGIAVIIPGENLDGGIAKAGAFLSRITQNLPEVFKAKTDLRIGLSSRAGRLVGAERLLLEASTALNKARTGSDPIIAFRIDPEKYREFIRKRS